MDKEKDITKLTFELQTISSELEANSKKRDEFNADFNLKAKQIQADLNDIKSHVESENDGLMKIENGLKLRLEHCNTIMIELIERAKLTGKNEDRDVIELLIGKYSELILEFDQFIKKYRSELLTSADKFKEHIGLRTEVLQEKLDENKQKTDNFLKDSQARIKEITDEMESRKDR